MIVMAILKGWKLTTVLFASSLALLAVADAASNRTLIVISLIGSGTTLVVGIMSALVSLHNSHKLLALSALPQKVDEFRREVDGRMNDLRESRMETSVAKQEVARAEGVAQERTEERERMATSGTTAAAEEKLVQKMEIVNEEKNPANVRAVKGKI